MVHTHSEGGLGVGMIVGVLIALLFAALIAVMYFGGMWRSDGDGGVVPDVGVDVPVPSSMRFVIPDYGLVA